MFDVVNTQCTSNRLKNAKIENGKFLKMTQKLETAELHKNKF